MTWFSSTRSFPHAPILLFFLLLFLLLGHPREIGNCFLGGTCPAPSFLPSFVVLLIASREKHLFFSRALSCCSDDDDVHSRRRWWRKKLNKSATILLLVLREIYLESSFSMTLPPRLSPFVFFYELISLFFCLTPHTLEH